LKKEQEESKFIDKKKKLEDQIEQAHTGFEEKSKEMQCEIDVFLKTYRFAKVLF
jgi:hypothetical protein